ncbi:hypothetical protein BDQ12DRAFT_691934 [Crucibulum laeve]|uniref:T6SS Phospholipase effector Tle1-like catalytic domain-containing protein n=1 Tax=Crucibulum laeve TaxID=68775 RepID=A0A5C3LJT5_9AGAR|nr:hypothetical protein BDQ12DRAFT_691934 [Crucibulum laeve]
MLRLYSIALCDYECVTTLIIIIYSTTRIRVCLDLMPEFTRLVPDHTSCQTRSVYTTECQCYINNKFPPLESITILSSSSLSKPSIMRIPWFSSKSTSEERAPLLANEQKPEPATIPPTLLGRARTLVLCFDGTGDKVDEDNTNVVELRDMLKNSEDHESEEQRVYYQKGIGTYTPKIPGVKEGREIPIVSNISKKWDEATASSLDGHVIEAYLWLVDTYRPGDKVCMFGFSRGAYTARALAGMLFKVGLLPTEHRDRVKAAFDSYQATDTKEGWEASSIFQQTWKSIDVPIEFVGCWDTVNSVGYLTTKSLPFTAFNPMVRTFRHAVALDERRAKFRTNLWNPDEKTLMAKDESLLNDVQKAIKSFIDAKTKGLPPTNVDEVWFSGCHCDIGGGAVPNNTKPNLAHISLRWMIRECFKHETGIMFQKEKLTTFHLNPDALYPIVHPRPAALNSLTNTIQAPNRVGPIDTLTGLFSKGFKAINPFRARSTKDEQIPSAASEEEADARDALAPVYDMLVIKPMMWLPFESFPFKTWDYKQGKMVRKAFNKKSRSARGPIFVDLTTKIFTRGPVKLHRTVLARMQALNPGGTAYVPKALFDGKEISVDAAFAGDHAAIQWVD